MVLGSATAGSVPSAVETPPVIERGSASSSTNALFDHDVLPTTRAFQSDVNSRNPLRASTMSPQDSELEAEARPAYLHVRLPRELGSGENFRLTIYSACSPEV